MSKTISVVAAIAAVALAGAAPASAHQLAHSKPIGSMTLRDQAAWYTANARHAERFLSTWDEVTAWQLHGRQLADVITPASVRFHERLLHNALRHLRMIAARLVVLAYPVPSWFWNEAMCVHSHEGSWTDTGDPYWGGLQFSLSTWQRAGGTGLPSNASVAEQVYRAYVIWKQDHGSWREWPNTARACGYL